MSNDILAEWKVNHFVVAPKELVDREQLIILTDIAYWARHIDELVLWCDQYGSVTKGMTVTLPDEQTLTLFCLKWA